MRRLPCSAESSVQLAAISVCRQGLALARRRDGLRGGGTPRRLSVASLGAVPWRGLVDVDGPHHLAVSVLELLHAAARGGRDSEGGSRLKH